MGGGPLPAADAATPSKVCIRRSITGSKSSAFICGCAGGFDCGTDGDAAGPTVLAVDML